MIFLKPHVLEECPTNIALYCDYTWIPPIPKFMSTSNCKASLCLILSLLPCRLFSALSQPCMELMHQNQRLHLDGQGLLKEITSPASSASAFWVWVISDGDQGWIRSPVAPSFWVREMDDMGSHSLLYLLSISFLQPWLLTFIVLELIVASHFSKEKSGEECSVQVRGFITHTHPTAPWKRRQVDTEMRLPLCLMPLTCESFF